MVQIITMTGETLLAMLVFEAISLAFAALRGTDFKSLLSSLKGGARRIYALIVSLAVKFAAWAQGLASSTISRALIIGLFVVFCIIILILTAPKKTKKYRNKRKYTHFKL